MQIAAYIREQPAILAGLPARIAGDLDRLKALAEAPDRILLLGAGSSMNALLAGADALEEATGATVLAKEPEAFLRLPPRGAAGRTLVLAASQSGMSATSVEAVRQAVVRGFPTLVITGDGASMIAETGADLLVLPIGKEAIGPKTKGYTATVLSVFTVAARLGGQKLDTSKLAPALERAVESGLAAARELRTRFGLPDYVLVAGQGPHLGTALEAGLKIAEISGVPTASFDTEEVLHGHVYGTTQASLVIVIAQTEAEAKAAARLGEAVTARGPRAAICNLSGHATRFDLAIDWPKAPALDWIAASWAVIPFQWYACELATARGVDPDKMIYPNLGAELGLRLKPVAP